MPPRQFERFGVFVRSGNAENVVGQHVRLARLADLMALLRRENGKLLHGERAGQPRRAVLLPERSFNQQRAGAAAGVVQAHSRPPWGQLHQRRSERFAQGRFAVPGAVSTAVEGFAGGVKGDAHAV